MLKHLPRVSLPLSVTASFLAVGSVAFLSTGFIGKKSHKADVRRFDTAIEVTINRTSPAFAALEDTLQDFEYSFDQAVSPYSPADMLMAGASDMSVKAYEIIADNQQTLAEEQRTRYLAQRKAEENMRKLQAFLQSTFAKKSEPVVQAVATTTAGDEDNSGMLVVSNGVISAFKPEATEASTASDVRTINLAELKIDKKELLKSLFLPLVTAENAAKAIKNNYSESARTKVDKQASSGSGDASDIATRKTENDSVGVRSESIQAHTIAGNLEMTGGLAVTSSKDQLVVYRDVDGERVESGYVWLNEARYEIYIDDNQGALVAELYTSRGELLGQGEFDLSTLSMKNSRASRIDGVNLKLKPVPRGLAGRAQSAYSYESKVDPVAEANVEVHGIEGSTYSKADGRFANDEVAAGSMVLTRTSRPNYWGTMAFATAGEDNRLTLFPNKMMTAFASVVGAKGKVLDDQPPVVWGKVTQGGKPVAGAKVELLTGDEPMQPVYFNALMIPDPSLTSTSANGLYAFYPVEPGVQVLQVTMGSSHLDPVIIPAEPGFVSNLDLEVQRTQKASVKIFDAFDTGLPLAAELRVLGNERTQSVGTNGTIAMRTARNQGLMVIDADAGDRYAVTRINVANDKRYQYIPMVKQDWVDSLRSHRRITREMSSGVIVGFVHSNDRYQVYASGSRPSSETKVVYFDARGNALDSNYGVRGGGYVIYNVPEGMTTVSVIAERMQGIQAVTTLTEQSVVNVIHHTIR